MHFHDQLDDQRDLTTVAGLAQELESTYTTTMDRISSSSRIRWHTRGFRADGGVLGNLIVHSISGIWTGTGAATRLTFYWDHGSKKFQAGAGS